MFFSDGWNNVPEGSAFSITLSGDAGFGLTGSHTVENEDGSVLRGEITFANFPLRFRIAKDERRKVKFDVLFTGAPATIEMLAQVEKADGSIFQDPSPFRGRVSASDKVLTVKLFANG